MTSTCIFPKRIIVRVIPEPVGPLAIGIYFEMRKKNNFGYTVFIHNAGIADIAGEELLNTFDTTRFLFLMDYVDPRSNFTGKLTAKVLSDSDLKRAADAFEIFRDKIAFPKDYEENLRAALARGQRPGNYRVEVQSN